MHSSIDQYRNSFHGYVLNNHFPSVVQCHKQRLFGSSTTRKRQMLEQWQV